MHKNHRIDFAGWQPVDNRLQNTLDSNSFMPDSASGARWSHPMQATWAKSKHKEFTAPITEDKEESKGEKKEPDTSAIEESKEEAKSAPEIGKKRTF